VYLGGATYGDFISNFFGSSTESEFAYSEILDVSEDLIVKSEIIAGNDIDTSILLDLPVCKTKSLGLSKQISLGKLARPVCLSCLLQVTVNTHARETEDRSICICQLEYCCMPM